MYYDLVLDGGGSRLAALSGAISTFEDRGYKVKRIAGTSAGALVGSLYAAGLSPAAIESLIFKTNFDEMLDGPRFKPWQIFSVLRHWGIHPGNKILHWLESKLAELNVHTFKDLRTGSNDPRYKYKFQCIATDLSNSRVVIFPRDAHYYGISPDKMSVAVAVRCSLSIPFIFYPVNLNNNTLVDGGVIKNYPIDTFDSGDIPSWPTFGVLLTDDSEQSKLEVDGIIDYAESLIKAMLLGHEREAVQDYIFRTIVVNTKNVKSTSFNLSKRTKQELIELGSRATMKFLNKYSWRNYREKAKEFRGL